MTGDAGVRFYAGAPIISPNGYALGAVCLIDTKPQKLSSVQERQLELIARQASRLIMLRKHNNQVAKKSQEILTQKSRSLRKVISRHQKKNNEISHSLHEEVAQSIASSKFYLRVAQDNPDKAGQLIDNVIDELEKVVSDIRQISYKMAHPARKILTIGELVKDMVLQMNELFPFPITLNTQNTLNVFPSEVTELVKGAIYEWMQILNQRGNTSDVHIRLSAGHELNLEMKDSHASFLSGERRQCIQQESIFDQIQAFEGTVKTTERNGVFASRITLPATAGRD